MSNSIFHVRPLDSGKGWAIDEYDGRGAWQRSVPIGPDGAPMDKIQAQRAVFQLRRKVRTTPLCIWSGCALYGGCMRPDVERILRACVAQRESEGLDRVPGQTELLCLEIKTMRDATYEARSHLGAIMIQTQPQDDTIIIGHVADALRILGGIAP